MQSNISSSNSNASPAPKSNTSQNIPTSNPSFDATCMKEGYLQKKGQLLKSWKRRWFVCDGRTISYYNNNKDKKAPNLVISLETCTVKDGGMSETWNSPRIYIYPNDGMGTMYCLSAEDGRCVTEWLTVLQCAAKKIKATAPGSERKPAASRRRSISSNSPNQARIPRTQTATANQIPTNLKLENELRTAFEMIQRLMDAKSAFTLVSVNNGVRTLTYTDASTQKTYIRGSVIINAPPDRVIDVVSNVGTRSQWDSQFTTAKVVASYGVSTHLLHYESSREISRQPILFYSFPPVTAGAVSALVCMVSSVLFGLRSESMPIFVWGLCGAIAGILATTIDVSPYVRPRDLLVVQHKREQADGSTFVLEKSVANELQPLSSGVVRAEISAGGFWIQPLDSTHEVVQTLLTYFTDIDFKGTYKRLGPECMGLQRMSILAHAREFVLQTNVFGESLSQRPSFSSSDDLTASGTTPSQEDSTDRVLNWKKGMMQRPAGGLKLTDKNFGREQRQVVLKTIKTFGKSILTGGSAVSLSLPVHIFEPRSMLERIVDLWLHAPEFLTRAASSTDPLERFQLVMAFAVAGLHMCVGQSKPFNPILGETYETSLSDGTPVFCEHTSHHPPISNFQIKGKGYMLWGYFILSGSFETNALTQTQTGPVHIDFDDGSRITYNMPYLRNGGMIMGDRVVEILGRMKFEDFNNQLSCELKLNPDELSGMVNLFAAAKTPSDSFSGQVIKGESEVKCEVKGSWLSTLICGDETIWDLERDHCLGNIRHENVLPSDCRFREDLQYLLQENVADAQEWKLKLELRQRKDRDARKKGRQPNHWANVTSPH